MTALLGAAAIGIGCAAGFPNINDGAGAVAIIDAPVCAAATPFVMDVDVPSN